MFFLSDTERISNQRVELPSTGMRLYLFQSLVGRLQIKRFKL